MRILTVFAHPDDESFGVGAVLARAARDGATIHGLFFTRGDTGESTVEPAPSPGNLGRLREQDLREATDTLGFAGIEVLDYGDGTLASVPLTELQAHVIAALRFNRPDVVITFGPGGITKHSDHIAIGQATQAAFQEAQEEGMPIRELFYVAVPPERAEEMGVADLPDGQPNTLVDVRETFPAMLTALKLHGRHIKDAREWATKLEQDPDPYYQATLYRVWPPVPTGVTLTGFGESLSGD